MTLVVAPLERMRVTPHGAWGYYRTDPRLCTRRQAPCTHYGVDLAAAPGTVVRAPEGGIVRVARDVASGADRPFSGYGPRVVLMQGDSGAWHLFAHLAALGSGLMPDVAARDAGADIAAAIRSSPGVYVIPGQRLGTVARDHLHWEVRPSPLASREQTQDPIAWLAARGASSPPATSSASAPARKRAPSAKASSSDLVWFGGALVLWYVLRRKRKRRT